MSKLPQNASFLNSQTHSVNDSAKGYDLFIPVAQSQKFHYGNVFIFTMPYLWVDEFKLKTAVELCWFG